MENAKPLTQDELAKVNGCLVAGGTIADAARTIGVPYQKFVYRIERSGYCICVSRKLIPFVTIGYEGNGILTVEMNKDAEPQPMAEEGK